MCHVGIDIAAASFDMVVRKGDQNEKVITFKQSVAGFDSAIEKLKGCKPISIVMEATGIYYFDLARALNKAGLPVCVINPKSFRHFAELRMKTTKTDSVDAALLADFGQCMKPRQWVAPDDSAMALRDIGRQINRLTHQKTQAKNRLHALQAKSNTQAFIIDDEADGIEHLERRIQRLTQAAKDQIKGSESLSTPFTNLTFANGVGEASGLAILAELIILPRCLKAPQVARYAGLDVRLTQSGTSVNKPGRLNKSGNSYLRSAMYMPALSASRCDPNARAFYESLVARGKKKKQAIIAIMRKYLMGIWACIQTGKPFDASLLFSEAHLKG